MNAEWSDLNKAMQKQLNRKDTFDSGIETLLILRKKMMEEIFLFKNELSEKDFCTQPFLNAKGYHNKTIAYSLWHVFRIEDIVVHSLIVGDEQVFFAGGYQKRCHSPMITTGNELVGEEIAAFSRKLDMEGLYQYLTAVNEYTTAFLKELVYSDLKKSVLKESKESLEKMQVVSNSELAWWLIDYWCSKDVKGLLRMPLSRHWIMHIEASMRIRGKIISMGNE